MAKFTTKNIEFKDGQKAIFGTDDDSYIMWDESGKQLIISTVVSGVYPTEPGHLTPMFYVDAAISGAAPGNHGQLTGLEDDDHPQYVPRDGSRGFTSTVSGVEPIEDYHLTTKRYVDFNMSRFIEGYDDQYIEVTRVSNKFTKTEVWRDSSKTFRIKTTETYRSGNLVTGEYSVLYDLDTGTTIVATISGTVQRTGYQVNSITYDRTDL
jgi:hypothetical protein